MKEIYISSRGKGINKDRMVGMRSGAMEADSLGRQEVEMGWLQLGGNNLDLVLYPLPFQMAMYCQTKFNPRVNMA